MHGSMSFISSGFSFAYSSRILASSACTSGSLDPSHVLLSIGLVHEVAHGSLRLTFSDYNTMEDVDYILKVLPGVIDRLRAMSPLWERIIKA